MTPPPPPPPLDMKVHYNVNLKIKRSGVWFKHSLFPKKMH